MKNFDKYLKGELTPKDMEIMTEKIIQGKFNDSNKAKWSQALEQKHEVSRTSSKKSRSIPLRYLGRIAAAAVVLLTIGIGLFKNFSGMTSAEMVNKHLALHFPNDETRKGASSISELKTNAINSYNYKDFEKSIEFRQTIIQRNKAEERDFFYLGLSYLYLESPQYDKAIEALEAARGMKEKNYKQEINWFLSLAFLKNNQLEAGKKELQKIVVSNGWKHQAARELLKSME